MMSCRPEIRPQVMPSGLRKCRLNPETDDFWPQDFINWNPGYAAYVPSAHDSAPWTVIPAYNGGMHTVQGYNNSRYGAGRTVEIPNIPGTVGWASSVDGKGRHPTRKEETQEECAPNEEYTPQSVDPLE
ncbi:hypothetical protein DL765_002562 [Monosporascus sp. GIB2]|nr:hypothetical protein DL765_002562 [Monosporascus sp. GIB2]